MNIKPSIFLLILAFLLFTALGDSVLPEPLKTASYNTRTTINKFTIGLFPAWQPKQKPHERTRKALEKLEKNTSTN